MAVAEELGTESLVDNFDDFGLYSQLELFDVLWFKRISLTYFSVEKGLQGQKEGSAFNSPANDGNDFVQGSSNECGKSDWILDRQ